MVNLFLQSWACVHDSAPRSRIAHETPSSRAPLGETQAELSASPWQWLAPGTTSMCSFVHGLDGMPDVNAMVVTKAMVVSMVVTKSRGKKALIKQVEGHNICAVVIAVANAALVINTEGATSHSSRSAGNPAMISSAACSRNSFSPSISSSARSSCAFFRFL